MGVASLLDTKRCCTVKTERIIGKPDLKAGLVEACGVCMNGVRNKLYLIISIYLTRYIIFYLFITEDHKIDGDRTFKNVLQSIINYQSVNDVLFRSNQKNVDPER